MSSDIYHTHRWRKLQAQFKAHCEAHREPCHRCRQPIDYRLPARTPDSFEADHRWPLALRPDLAYSRENLRASHKRCNGAAGATSPEHQEWIVADW